MRFLRERAFLLLLAVILVFSAVMAVRQYAINRTRHAELREAFIFLHSHGYHVEAEKLYSKLLWNLQREPTEYLINDVERTSLIVPTNQSPSTNILVRFHRSIKRELDSRFEQEYLKARKLAEPSS